MNGLTPEANENRNELERIKANFLAGRITEDGARELAKPIIARMNEAGERIAKEYGMRFKKLTFAYLMR